MTCSSTGVELAALLLMSATAPTETLIVILAKVIDEFRALVAQRPGNAFATAATPTRFLTIVVYTARLSYVSGLSIAVLRDLIIDLPFQFVLISFFQFSLIILLIETLHLFYKLIRNKF